jgi:hypothetical protein
VPHEKGCEASSIEKDEEMISKYALEDEEACSLPSCCYFSCKSTFHPSFSLIVFQRTISANALLLLFFARFSEFGTNTLTAERITV